MKILLILLNLCCFCNASQITYLKNKFGSRSKLDLCYKNLTTSTNSQATTCQKYATQKYCLDIRLPYRTSIIPDYTPDLQSIEQISSYIEKWEQFRSLPKCWHYLQVVLCSIFMPQLDDDPTSMRATRVSQPSVDSCNNMFKHCKFISRHYTWPAEFFNCSDTNIYAKNCSNEFRDFRHKSHTCQYPLVPSNDSSSWFRDVDGCSMHCKYPVLDTGDQEHIKFLIQILSTCGFFITLIAKMIQTKSSMLSQVIDWCLGSQILFYVGWSLQTILGRDIACSSSGASLYNLPFVANACILSFALTYLPMLCFSIWYAYMGQVCHQELIEKESNEANVDNDTRRIKLVKWLSILLPSALFIAVLFIGQIDGNGLYGICTVGQKSIILKSLFVFAPDFICTTYGNLYLIRTIYKLSTVIDKNPTSKRIHMQIVILIIFNSTRLLLSIGNQFYAHRNQSLWEESVDKLVACKLNPHLNEIAHDMDEISINRQDCELNIKNLVLLYYIELISNLGLGIIIAWWALCDINFNMLKKMIINFLEDENRHPTLECEDYGVQMDMLRNRDIDDNYSNCSRSTAMSRFINDSKQYLSRGFKRIRRDSLRQDRPIEVTVNQEQPLKVAYDFHAISAQIQDRLKQNLVTPQPQFYFYGNRMDKNDE